MVRWTTAQADMGLVEWGEWDDLYWQAEEAAAATLHGVELAPLKPGTRYAYRVHSGGAASEIHHFHAAPPAGVPAYFTVFGDNQNGPDHFVQVANDMREWGPNLVLGVGDHVQDGADPALPPLQLFEPAESLFSEIPFYAALGNHDWGSPWFFDYFDYPHPDVEGEKANYYSFTWGNTFFLVLNTNSLLCPLGEIAVPQSKWLKETLASPGAAQATWRVAYAHEPGWSESWSPGNCYYDGNPCIRNFVLPLLAEHGFHLYFAGHTHAYERGMVDGIVHIITGGGGGSLDEWCTDLPSTSVIYQEHHFLRVEAGCDSLVVEAQDISGVVFDWVELAAGKPGQVVDEGPMPDLPTLKVNTASTWP